MSDEWIGVIKTTTPKYMKGASDMTIRKRLFLAMLKKKGRITYNNSGYEVRWQVEYSQPAMHQHGDGSMIDFTNHDAFQQCVLPVSGYEASDSITMKQRAMNSGSEALVNLFKTKQGRIMKKLSNGLAGEIYKAGGTSGRENAIYGLETALTERTAPAAGDLVAEPSVTYAGLSTALANQGGTWSAVGTAPNSTLANDWPYGQGDSEYDYFSPKLVNWSSTAWGTGSTTFEDNAWRVIGTTITWLTTLGGDDGMPDICVLHPKMMQDYKNHEEAIRRFNISQSNVGTDLGFKGNALNQDGCVISGDYDCPVNTGYMVNLSSLELMSWMPELFWMKGPDEDPRSAYSTLWASGLYGQLKIESPKHIAKLKNFA